METRLRVGTYETDITPKLGTHLIGGFGPRIAVAIKDPLHAKAIVLSDEEALLALLTVDLCMIRRDYLDLAKARIRERTGIPPQNVLISATHTHTGPAATSILAVDIDHEYAAMVAHRAADAVECALHRLQPCRFSYGTGTVDQVFNRRWYMRDGTVRCNPGYQDDRLDRPAGPVDRELGLLAFSGPEGTPLALYVNYSLHYVGSSPSNHVSADYFARVDQNLRRSLGVPLAVIANGTSGDVNNCDFRRPAPKHDVVDGQTIKVAGIVAAEAARVYYQACPSAEATLAGALREIAVTRREPDAEQLAADERTVADMDRLKPTSEQVYAFERLALAREPREQKTWVQALRIGDVALVGLPGEIFVEFGLRLKDESPIRPTFCTSLANDWVGYVPTPKALEEGGYETWTARSSKLTADAGPSMVRAALELLEGTG